MLQRLSKTQKAFYSCGHILNDLCSNCWFSYVLLYMTKVVGLSDTDAGLILLIGQVADALLTVVIGLACDKTRCRFYGRRKLWHAIGVISVAVSFPFIFNTCLGCRTSSEWVKILYYSAFVVLFQFGWACTQISHLALIPELTRTESQKVELNSIRSGLTFFSGIVVFGITWLLLGTSGSEESITESASKQFMILAFIVISLGGLLAVVFHFGVTEKPRKKTEVDSPVHTNCAITGDIGPRPVQTSNKSKKWKDWLKSATFYKVALLYMCSRLAWNVFQSFFPLYLADTLHFKKEAVAYLPLCVLVAGAATSIVIKPVTKKIGFQLVFLIGVCFYIVNGFWLYFVPLDLRDTVYGVAILAGSGSSIMIVSSLAKTAEIIGQNQDSGSFVYGILTFTDKITTGIVIFIIQTLRPTTTAGALECLDCKLYSKIVQACVPAISCAVAGVGLIVLFPNDMFKCCKKREIERTPSTEPMEGGESSSNNVETNKKQQIDTIPNFFTVVEA